MLHVLLQCFSRCILSVNDNNGLIRTVHDVITYLHERNLSGMLLLIDFEKAFDTVKWSAIDKTLSFFNFGQSFRNWIKVIYHNVQSVVLNNGYISKFFEPQKGVRQGCPLSCYLFILVVEILAIKVWTNNAIKGITVSKKELKISTNLCSLAIQTLLNRSLTL